VKHPSAIIADDHGIVVDGLRTLLRKRINLITTCADGGELLQAILTHQPELVITDLSLPTMTGLEVLRGANSAGVSTRTIFLSMHSDPEIVRATLAAGARAYLPKLAAGEELLTAIDAVMEGNRYLSPLLKLTPAPPRPAPQRLSLTSRQKEVLALVAAGKRMKEIAAELHLSRRTVEMHKYHMMRTLKLKSTAELVRFYMSQENTLERPDHEEVVPIPFQRAD
jgi:DNA-binding NarL/FixJ family response regulator